jgi:hypothetical protein
MYRTSKNFDIKLRLDEINRRSIELSATSSELANLAAQLDHLRKVNERIRIFATRTVHSNRRRDGNSLSRRHLANSRLGIPFSRGLADEH